MESEEKLRKIWVVTLEDHVGDCVNSLSCFDVWLQTAFKPHTWLFFCLCSHMGTMIRKPRCSPFSTWFKLPSHLPSYGSPHPGPPSNHNKSPKPGCFPLLPQAVFRPVCDCSALLIRDLTYVSYKSFYTFLGCVCVIYLHIQTNFWVELCPVFTKWPGYKIVAETLSEKLPDFYCKLLDIDALYDSPKNKSKK